MEYYRLLPEIFMLFAGCAILLVDLYVPQKRQLLTYTLTQIALVVTFFMSLAQFNHIAAFGFHGNFIRDNFGTLLEMVIVVIAFVTFLFSRSYIESRGNMNRGEYYVLGLFSVLGMMVLVTAYSMLTIYLGLELMSLPLYAMIAMHREDTTASEAAVKYFVMGAIASGMLLFGMSLIFGATGHLTISAISQAISNMNGSLHNTTLILGLIFIVIGLAFKLGGVPFHMWVPDVYQGAPMSVTLFVSTAPKVAAFGMTIRLLIDMLPTLHTQWQPLLILVAILSMGIGNLLAIAQENVKRMLAYSGIAHIGYLSLGLIAVTQAGYQDALFYMVVYAFMSLAAFSMLIVLSRQGFDCEKISDLKGLNQRSPWLAFMMLLVMFSMAGIPPLIGFFAKLSVLEALIGAHLVWLAVVAIVCAIIGLYYYLRVVKVMYFDEAETNEDIRWQGDERVIVSVNCLALLFFGLFPGAIFMLCHLAF
jgi:NADH-quinone oxidoreductase subunit N